MVVCLDKVIANSIVGTLHLQGAVDDLKTNLGLIVALYKKKELNQDAQQTFTLSDVKNGLLEDIHETKNCTHRPYIIDRRNAMTSFVDGRVSADKFIDLASSANWAPANCNTALNPAHLNL